MSVKSHWLLWRTLTIALLALVLVFGAVPSIIRPLLPGPMGDMGRSSAEAHAPLNMAALTAQHGSVVTRLDEAFLQKLAQGRTNVAAPQELPAGMHPLTAQCSDIAIIGVRGSGESATENNGLGETVNAAVAMLADNLVGYDVAVHAINYPADPVSTLITSPSTYLAGIQNGANRLATMLSERSAQCPQEKRIVIGFSQGAMVAHSALSDMGAAGNATRAATTAVLLVSDGMRTGVGNMHQLGTAQATPGLVPTLGLATQNIPPAIGERTISVCDHGDPVCNPSSTGVNGVETHTSYKIGHPVMREATETIAALTLAQN